MTIGPCLCGDPYCGSCFPGNDGGAFEEFIENLSEELGGLTEEECYVFVVTGRAAVEAHNKAMKDLDDKRKEFDGEAGVDMEW